MSETCWRGWPDHTEVSLTLFQWFLSCQILWQLWHWSRDEACLILCPVLNSCKVNLLFFGLEWCGWLEKTEEMFFKTFTCVQVVFSPFLIQCLHQVLYFSNTDAWLLSFALVWKVTSLKGTVHLEIKNIYFPLSPVALFIHLDCFGVSCRP